MNNLIDWLNAVTAAIVNFILWPTASLSASLQLVWISIVAGIIFLLLYGMVSSQAAIKSVKRKIHAALLEVVLYRHDIRVSLAAQGRLFAYGGLYFLIAVPPILVLMIPCVLMLSQLNARFAYKPLKPGTASIVKAQVNDRRLLYRVGLELPGDVEVSPALRIPETQEVLWRVIPREAGRFELNLKLGETGKVFKDQLIVDGKTDSIVSHFYKDWWWRVLYPDTKMKGFADYLNSLTIAYPEEDLNLGGLKMHWIVIFAIVSILSGIVASRMFKIEI